MDWVYKNSEPDALLKDLATREVIHYLAGVDLNDVLSQGRLQAADALRDRIQSCGQRAFARRENYFCRLAGHSSADGQRSRRDLRKSRRRGANATRQNPDAEAAAIRTNALADAQAFTLTNVADANRVQQVSSAFARAALFTNQIPAFEAAPSVYRQRLYLKNFAAATKNARKYVLLVTNTQDVIWS